MPIEEIRCPKCGTTRRTVFPVSYQCRGCNARISVDANGCVRRIVPAKKK